MAGGRGRSRAAVRAAALLLLVSVAGAAGGIPERVVVLANTNLPTSVTLAHHYLAARSIPETNLILLDLPTGEDMTRWHYKHHLLDPMLAALRERNLIQQVRRTDEEIGRYQSGWRTIETSIDTVVSMHGVPLRIADTKPFSLDRISTLTRNPQLNNGAAVDSELALALLDAYDLDGPFRNPLYQEFVTQSAQHPSQAVLITARLDGPNPDTVRRMIDDAVMAETDGLHGYAAIDLQNIRERGYVLGDYWIWEAGERLAREGFSVIRDSRPEIFPLMEPLEHLAVYLGWYEEDVRGPFAREDFRFQPGAIAYHLHSGSARTLRSTGEAWAGPLLARGAAAVMGAVAEPYLRYTPNLKVFIEHLCSGMTFGQSALAAQQVLSWQVTVVGDPLYRPFRFPPEVHRARLGKDNREGQAWVTLRLANRMVRDGRLHPAMALLRQGIRDTGSTVLKLRLADLYAVNQLETIALDLYREVVREAGTAETAVRAGRSAVDLLRAANRGEDADTLIHEIRAAWRDHPTVQALLLPPR